MDNTYNYEELLTRLGIIENAKNDVENSQEEIIKEDTTAKDQEENKQEKEDKKKTKQHQARTNKKNHSAEPQLDEEASAKKTNT